MFEPAVSSKCSGIIMAVATCATGAAVWSLNGCRCGKCVWMGPKSYAAINLLEGLFTEGKSRPTPLQSTRGREHGDDPI